MILTRSPPLLSVPVLLATAAVLLMLLLAGRVEGISVTGGGSAGTFTVLNSSLHVVLANQSVSSGQRFGVLAWQRADSPAPGATVVPAAAIDMPASLLNCSALTVDVPLLRTLGSSYRAPLSGTLWVFADDAAVVGANRPFNASRALAQHRFAPEPSEGNWTVLGASGGVTVDEGTPAKRFHVETYRFRLTNLSLAGARRYWIALAVELERAFNATDFSLNQPRWLLADGGLVSMAAGGATPFRVVDRYGSMFLALPALANWTNGTNLTTLAAAGVIAPAGISANVSAQLALVAYASGCMNVSAVKTLDALVPQATTYRVLAPAGTPTPTPSPPGNANVTGGDDATPTPTPAPTPSPTPPPPPSVITPTVLPSPSAVGGSPSGSMPTPPTPDTADLTSSSSPSPTPSSPSPGGNTPTSSGGSTPSKPWPASDLATPTPTNTTSGTAVAAEAREWWQTPAATWGFVSLGGVCLLVLVLVALYLAARRFHPNVTDLSYAQLLQQNTGAAAAGGGGASSSTGDEGGDASAIPLDDLGTGPDASVTLDALAQERRRAFTDGIALQRRTGGSGSADDEDDDDMVVELDQARASFDLATMREVPLDHK